MEPNFLFIIGPILSKDKKLLGIVSHSSNGMPQICISVMGRNRDFIDNPRVNLTQGAICSEQNTKKCLIFIALGVPKRHQCSWIS